MAKKVFIIILRTIAILLVLVYMMALLFSNKDFLGKPVTYLLMACLGVLGLFFIYLMFTNIADAAKKQKHDEDNLNEKHIEKIFTGASIAKQKTMQGGPQRLSQEENPDWLEEEFLSIRKQAEYEARLAAEAAAEKKWQQEVADLERADLETRIERTARAEAEARRIAGESLNEEDRRIAKAEMEALERSRHELQAQLAEQDNARIKEQKEEEKRRQAEEEAAALRKTQAIESVRKQAETAVAARRRAAATSATQSFAAAPGGFATGVIPALNAPSLYAQQHAQAGTAGFPVPQQTALAAGQTQQNIWQQMNAPQVAPSYAHGMNTASFTYNSAPRPVVPQRTGAIPPVYNTMSFAAQSGGANMSRTQQIAAVSGPNTAYNTSSFRTVSPHTQSFATPPTHTQAFGVPVGAGAATAANAQRAAAARALGNTQSIPMQRHTQSIPAFGNVPPGSTAQFAAQHSTYAAQPPYGVPQNTQQIPVQQQYPTGYSRPRESGPSASPGSLGGGSAQVDLPRRRGRPPKPRTPEEESAPKRPRGRPPKPKTEEELSEPKRLRGRPPKVRTPEELAQMNEPKRPRGRPRKDGTEDHKPTHET